MKKTIIIISVVLGILAMAVGVYFAWKKSRELLTPPIIDQRPTIDDQRLPALAEKKIKILSDQPIFDYWVYQPQFVATATATSTGTITRDSIVFYFNQDGLLFKVKEDAEDEAIMPEPIDNLQSIKSSFDGKLALIKFGDANFSGFVIFNAETKVQEFLPENITAAAFSPDAKKIVYLQKQVGFKTASDLIIKELTGAKPKTTKILSFNQMDFDLDWILPETVILTPKPSAFSAASAWSVDIKNKTFKPLWPIDLSGLMINWSIDGRTDGKLGLQFNSGGRETKNSLILINEKGEKQANFDFLTLPNKCFFAEPKIYCAVPLEIPKNTILPDDYLKKAVYFKDFLYQINISQNSLSEIFSAAEPIIDAVNLRILDNKLLFINRYDNRLYSLEL
ncbi:MAG: hypothetical protein Q8N28_00085 [bacterium]|nr:hypothetical protein [bacterium]